jgi:hypothetical protein
MSTHTPESIRIETYNGLVHCIVSNTDLWDTIDVAEVKEVVADALALVPDLPLTLEPLWQYMRAKGAPHDAAAATILLFHSRAERFHCEMVLPPELAVISEGDRTSAVEQFRSKGGTSGTFIGKAPTAHLHAPTPQPRPAATRAPTPSARQKPPPARAGDNAVARATTTLVRAAFVCAAAAFAFVHLHGSDKDGQVTDALGEMCTSVKLHGRAALCTVSVDALSDKPRAKERADVTGVALGVTVLFVNAAGEVVDVQ